MKMPIEVLLVLCIIIMKCLNLEPLFLTAFCSSLIVDSRESLPLFPTTMDFSYRTTDDESPSASPSTMGMVDEGPYVRSLPETSIGNSYWDLCSNATGDAWGADLGNSLIIPISLDARAALQEYPEGVDPSVLTIPPIPDSFHLFGQHGMPPLVPEELVPGSAPIDSEGRSASDRLQSGDVSYHLVQLRQMMDERIDSHTRHLLASLLYYNNLLVGLNSAEANKLASLVLDVSLRSVTRWKEVSYY